MRHEDFNTIVNHRFEECAKVLIRKDKEYSSGTDRLHNFYRAAALMDCTPVEALLGMWAKHLVSIIDVVQRMTRERGYVPSQELVAEKFGDNINYTLLLEGLIEDARREGGL